LKKNVVFITAIGYPEKLSYAQYCFNTWEWWCRKNNVHFFIIDKKRCIDIPPVLMRYYVFDIMEESGINYEQIALIDADTMVKWNCPDFFKFSDHKFSVVLDSSRFSWTQKSINSYSHLFPDVPLSFEEYFNAGFMIVNQDHISLFDDMLEFSRSKLVQIREIRRKYKKGIDQTLINFMVKKAGIKRNFLPVEYNYKHFVSFFWRNRILIDKFNLDVFIKKGYIWHFLGMKKSLSAALMKKTWESVKGYYRE